MVGFAQADGQETPPKPHSALARAACMAKFALARGLMWAADGHKSARLLSRAYLGWDTGSALTAATTKVFS
ncbi:hypothetical protein ALI144C_20950 [Actinosynnema sp. ALI-1.44]|nr:hypothetical protein ALI144C_20950 [Actinosynnema sp. ALI-1.44]